MWIICIEVPLQGSWEMDMMKKITKAFQICFYFNSSVSQWFEILWVYTYSYLDISVTVLTLGYIIASKHTLKTQVMLTAFEIIALLSKVLSFRFSAWERERDKISLSVEIESHGVKRRQGHSCPTGLFPLISQSDLWTGLTAGKGRAVSMSLDRLPRLSQLWMVAWGLHVEAKTAAW